MSVLGVMACVLWGLAIGLAFSPGHAFPVAEELMVRIGEKILWPWRTVIRLLRS